MRRHRLAPVMGPLLLELGLILGVGVAGTWLAARQGNDAAAAFALGHHVAGLFFVLLRIIGAGISVVVAQHLGAGQEERARRAAGASIAASTWLGVVLMVAAGLPATQWMQWMQAPSDIAPMAARLLMMMAPALALDACLAAQSSVLRAHLKVRLALLLNGLIQGLQLVLAIVLMPRMGLDGFAWALLASRLLGVLLAAWMCNTALGLPWRWRTLLNGSRADLADVLHVGVPAAAENILYRLCATVSVAVAGSLGAATLTAPAYALQVNALTILPGIALGLAIEVLVGHAIGQGHLRQAHRRVSRALAAGLACSVLLSVGLALAGPSLIGTFTQDPQVSELALMALWWTVLLEPGRTFNLVVINGLRAAGDTRFPVMAGAVSMVVVLAGGSWLLGQHWGMGLSGIWLAYAADEWIRGLIMWHRWQRLRWVPQARRVFRLRRGARAP